MHPQVDISRKENLYGTDRFHEMFQAISRVEWAGRKTCQVVGVRCEETPTRMMGLTNSPSYKWVTWGAKHANHITLYPLYDWSYSDVWKAILDNGWSYNRIYDAQYRYGLPVKSMRVSNVHHETSVESLFYAQEVEPETYERIVQRLHGVDMAAKMGKSDYFSRELPPMFASWREYRDYLLAHLIDNPVWRAGFETWFKRFDAALGPDNIGRPLWTGMVNAILCNDWEGVKLANRWRDPEVYDARRKRKLEATRA